MNTALELNTASRSAVLPGTDAQGVRWNANTSGPRALMLAVLEDALGTGRVRGPNG
jgi:hypothetical protein